MWSQAAMLLSAGLLLACGPDRRAPDAGPLPRYERTVEIDPRIPHLAGYPCGAQCHDARQADPTPRELTAFHTGRVVRHGPAIRFCDACHSLEHPDELRLMDGALVSFDASDRVCGQCHGEKHRDWELGLHGTVTGGWRGVVRHRQCTACHDPHAPGPIHLEALPPPTLDPRTRVERRGHR
jgi:hypothetical protein